MRAASSGSDLRGTVRQLETNSCGFGESIRFTQITFINDLLIHVEEYRENITLPDASSKCVLC